MILITGATGNLGKATINYLLKEGVEPNGIAALARDKVKATDLKAKGVDVRIGDYGNYDSLSKAFEGVNKLLLISSNEMQNREQQHLNVVDAAKQSGIKHIYYTSFARESEQANSPISFLAKSHFYTEQIIKRSGMSYTIFRNGLYADMLPFFFGEKVLKTGIFFPAGETKASFTLRKDMAEAIAHVLNSDGHYDKEYTLVNPKEVSLPEIADILSKIVGEKIVYHNQPTAEYLQMAESLGIPEEYAEFIASFGESIKEGAQSHSKGDLESLIGREPTSIKKFLSKMYS